MLRKGAFKAVKEEQMVLSVGDIILVKNAEYAREYDRDTRVNYHTMSIWTAEQITVLHTSTECAYGAGDYIVTKYTPEEEKAFKDMIKEKIK